MRMGYYPLLKGILDIIIFNIILYGVFQMTKAKNVVYLSMNSVSFQRHEFYGK